MGSIDDEPGSLKAESPNVISITRPFALLDREITFEELIAFDPHYLENMAEFNADPKDAGFGANWYDSVEICRWLGRNYGLTEADQAYPSVTQLPMEQFPRDTHPHCGWAPQNWPVYLEKVGFRLPTEAEWECACRAGTRSVFSFGDDPELLENFAIYLEHSDDRAHPPKQRRPTHNGLFDMHGNLYEWCHNWFARYDESTTDPIGRSAGALRMMRGGAWNSPKANCRVAGRNSSAPPTRAYNLGFRLALTIQESLPAIQNR